MINLVDQPMRLMYFNPENHSPIDAGPERFETDWYDDWVNHMVKIDPTFIFFLVTQTTDVFEKEWDFNEVAMPPPCTCPGAPYHLDKCPLSKNYKPADRLSPEFNHGFHYESIFIQDSTQPPTL